MLAGDLFDDGAWLIGQAVGAAAVVGYAGWNAVNGVMDNVQKLLENPDNAPEKKAPPVPEPVAEPVGDDAAREAQKKWENNNFQQYLEELGLREVKEGVQSPLGPGDPNQWEAIGTLPNNEDPQAPLKPGFFDSPEPIAPTGLGANVVRIYKAKYGPWNPTGASYYVVKPSFRGKRGSGTTQPVDRVVFSAVPKLDGDLVKWTARAEMFNGAAKTGTNTWDAGLTPPVASEFGLYFIDDFFGGESDLLSSKEAAFGTSQTFSLSQPVAPLQLDPKKKEIPGPVPLPLPNPGRDTDWQPVPQPEPLPDPDRPRTPVIAPPTIIRDAPVAPDKIAPKPDRVAPTEVNNPAEVPSIDSAGIPMKIQEMVKTLNANTHMVGKLAVASQTMRSSLSNIAKEVGRIEAKNAAMIPTIGALADLLPLLIGGLPGGEGSKAPASTVSMRAYCDVNDEGTPEVMSIIYPETEMLQGILERLEDIPAFLEQHLAWKTPTCGNEKPTLEGDWVTTRWKSDEIMDHSGTRLRKLFRYRSKSTRDLKQLSDYWRDFVWTSGGTCVQHQGAWWGTPQVWAASEDEGRRVIRHAAGEAGIDPDQTGEWTISSSRSPRIGMQGTMRIQMHQGFPWVASRDGSSWPNQLAR